MNSISHNRLAVVITLILREYNQVKEKKLKKENCN